MPNEIWAIVVAAGDGTRFGRPKQFERLADRLVVEWAVDAARTVTDNVVLVLPKDALSNTALHAGCRWTVEGGETRSGSVRNGLVAVPDSAEIIVVHDAARPLASKSLFGAVVGAVVDGADGAVPGLAIKDTIKRVAGSHVVETLARDELVAVQTPQAFRAGSLRRAHEAHAEATDDAALVEQFGGTVVVVPGEIENAKLTEASDLAGFQTWLCNETGRDAD